LYHSFRLTTGEISDENQKKVTDLENEVRGLKVTVEKKEHDKIGDLLTEVQCILKFSITGSDKGGLLIQ
jgi:polyhydroxyalkanoate synthesis regulator phasin